MIRAYHTCNYTARYLVYREFPKYSDTQKICCKHFKIWTMWLYHRVMSPNDADRMANSVDPDQTAPLSGSALFAQAYPPENLGSLPFNTSEGKKLYWHPSKRRNSFNNKHYTWQKWSDKTWVLKHVACKRTWSAGQKRRVFGDNEGINLLISP